MSFKREIWILNSYRPGMKIMDAMRNKKVQASLKAYLEGAEDPYKAETRNFVNQEVAHLQLKHDAKEMKEMVIAEADDKGRFVTEDPILARTIYDLLMDSIEINNPNPPYQGVKCDIDDYSPAIPTDAEIVKLLEARNKEAKKPS